MNARTALDAFTAVLQGAADRRAIWVPEQMAGLFFDEAGQHRRLADSRRRILDWIDRSDLSPRERTLLSLRHGLDLTVLPILSGRGPSLATHLTPHAATGRGRRPKSPPLAPDAARAIRYELQKAYGTLEDSLGLDEQLSEGGTAQNVRDVFEGMASDDDPIVLRQRLSGAILLARRASSRFPEVQEHDWLSIDWWMWKHADIVNPRLEVGRPSTRVNQERIAAGGARVSVALDAVATGARVRRRRPERSGSKSAALDRPSDLFASYLANADRDAHPLERIEHLLATLEGRMTTGSLPLDLSQLLDHEVKAYAEGYIEPLAPRVAVVLSRAAADLPQMRTVASRWVGVALTEGTPDQAAEVSLNTSVSLSGEGRFLEAEAVLQAASRVATTETAVARAAIGMAAWRRRMLTNYIGGDLVSAGSISGVARDLIRFGRLALTVAADPTDPDHLRALVRVAEGLSIAHILFGRDMRFTERREVDQVRAALDDSLKTLDHRAGDLDLTAFDRARLRVVDRVVEAIESGKPMLEFGVKAAADGTKEKP